MKLYGDEFCKLLKPFVANSDFLIYQKNSLAQDITIKTAPNGGRPSPLPFAKSLSTI
jgi:hypothetical protein